MRLRSSIIVLVVLASLFVFTASASAANGAKVLADWRADGVIDGDYKLADLRAADSQVNAQEREYYFWDEAYAEAVRRINDPDAPPSKRLPTVPPQDFDKDGDIDATDVATAKRRTKAIRAKLRKCDSGNAADRPKGCPERDRDEPVRAEKPDDDSAAVAVKDSDDDGGLGWLAALLFVIPAGVIGFGAWRMQRGKRGTRSLAEPDAPTSSFAAGDDA